MNNYDPSISLETAVNQITQLMDRAIFLQDGNSQALCTQILQKLYQLPETLEPSEIFVPS